MNALDIILSEFDKQGCKAVNSLLDTVNYGIPQFRERLVVIGSGDNEDIILPFPGHLQMHQNQEYLWRTLSNTILAPFVSPSEEAIFGNVFFEPIAATAEGSEKV